MAKFIYFTPEEKARAQNTDLVSLLRAQGERPIRSGREYRTPIHFGKFQKFSQQWPPSTLPSTQFFTPILETPAIAAKIFEISENV